MKRLLTLGIIALTVCASLVAQTIQTGVIQEYNEKDKKTPLPGVELNVRSAQSTISDKSGNFSLHFLSLKPGEKVNVRKIEKLGYEIFNKEAIEQWNINPTAPFVIVMCRSEKFKAIRDNYMRKASDNYEKQYQKEQARLAKLKEDGKIKEAEYQKQLAELVESYDRQLDNLDSYVDRFSRIDLSQLSKIEQEIIDLIQKGEFEAAIKKYEEQNYIDQYIQEAGELKQVSSAIDQLSDIKIAKEQNLDSLLAAIDRQIETLKLAGGSENFDKIINLYEKVLSSEQYNIDFVFRYLDLLNALCLFDRVIELYSTKLSFIQFSPIYTRKLLYKIANALLEQQNLDGAIEYYNKALSILGDGQYTDNPDFQYTKSTIIHNLGDTYFRRKDFVKSNELLSIPVPINEDEKNVILELKRLTNFAASQRAQKNYTISDSLYNIALNRCNYEFHNYEHQEELKYILSILSQGEGNLLVDTGNFNDAEKYYNHALDIATELYNRNPKRYASHMATINYNMGRLFVLQDSLIAKAIPYYKASLGYNESILREHFIQQSFDNYAGAFSLLARVYYTLGDKEKALSLCAEADKLLEICKDFPAKGATLLFSLGAIYADLKDYPKTFAYYDKAQKALALMYDEYPQIYGIKLALLYSNYGQNCCRVNNPDKGNEYFAKSLKILKELYGEETERQAIYKDTIRRAYIFLLRTSEYKAGLEYLRILQKMEPSNYRNYEIEIITLYGKGEKEEAIKAFKRFISNHPEYPKDSELYELLKDEAEK